MTTNATVTVDAVKVAEQRLGRFIIFADFVEALQTKDGAGTVDGMLVSYFKTLTDDYRVADVAVRDFRKSLADSGIVTDDQVMAFVKGVAEVVTATDLTRVALAKPIADSVGITDDVDGVASALDDQEMSFFKVTSSTAVMTDLFFRQVWFSRQFSEPVSVSDTGLLWSQDYCDFSYFSEDFVGSSRSF